ncbi:MAG TPA: ergothioneine biosynthesis protein EgtB [Terracidiphilus sp.]|jgi:ergothioneine biosynthesis protein EgtB
MARTKAAIIEAGPEVAERFASVRQRSLELCSPLTPEDMMVQSCAEASPAKWHLAHTAWFFESFVLREFLPGYRLFNPDFPWLFNSYYEGFSAFPEKRLRSSFSRPGAEEVLRYRAHVDEAMERLLASGPEPEALRRIELGANHEEQHQELLLTDMLHAFFTNPLRRAYLDGASPDAASTESQPLAAARFEEFEGGLREVGYAGDGFCFDNELGRHQVWLRPYALASRLVTCAEYLAFMADGGYQRPELWLSAGWAAIRQNGWRAPLYWSQEEGASGDWSVFTLRGPLPLDRWQGAPVSHLSYYEAEAYARWSGCRLPTEFEWEVAAEGRPIGGNLLESGNLRPVRTSLTGARHAENALIPWGDCWNWTGSAYLPYPGFKPLEGALGEYNGKFMSGQMVLRGGSCVTPERHIRPSYRNFFAPETRWQFSGIRLAS